MKRIRLVHWSAEEAEGHLRQLRDLGYQTDFDARPGPELFRQLTAAPPDAMVIDLSRLPSAGRDMALEVRHRRSTRRVPIVFVEGKPEKVKGVRELLPDAVFADWLEIGPALERAIQDPPSDPVVPASRMAAYAGVPLATKLGIRAGSAISLLDAPEGFRRQLGELPEGVTLNAGRCPEANLTIWFVRSKAVLKGRIDRAAARAVDSPLWIAWPKKRSDVESDLTQSVVRELAEAAGLVDYKICSFDSTWSGLLFTRRGDDSTRPPRSPEVPRP